MTNKQLDFMFEHQPPEGVHPYAQLFLHPLGMKLTSEMMDDLAAFLFDMVGVKLHDVEPSSVEYSREWKDPREVDEIVPGSEFTAAWCEQLPPGVSLDSHTGRMVGVLPPGMYSWVVHLGPQVKYDAMGGSGSPHEDGRWIGALEERTPIAPSLPDVSTWTVEQKAALRAALDEED